MSEISETKLPPILSVPREDSRQEEVAVPALRAGWRPRFAPLTRAAEALREASLVSVDVFDTVLLRGTEGETGRLRAAAMKAVAQFQAATGRQIDAAALTAARLDAARAAYASLKGRGAGADVAHEALVKAACVLFDHTGTLATLLAESELRQEQQTLRLNAALCADLRDLKAAGKRLIAISDTPYSAAQLSALIAAAASDVVLDHVYSSSDANATKREGGLFAFVAAAEQATGQRWVHIGDDPIADGTRAQVAGALSILCPRNGVYTISRRWNAGRGRIQLSQSLQVRQAGMVQCDDPNWAAAVLGPIVAEICFWLFAFFRAAPHRDRARALFCARGGLVMQLCYEAFLEAADVASPVPAQGLMISRLAAIRPLVLLADGATDPHLNHELRDHDCRRAAASLSGIVPEGENWAQPFEAALFRLLLTQDAQGVAVREQIKEQADLLGEHFAQACDGAETVFLCDTGLFGSTGRYLKAAFPKQDLTAVLLARAATKPLPREHFAYTVGLISQHDRYRPWVKRSVMLRHWYFFEHLFEPPLPSVQWYQRREDGAVVSNLEAARDWRAELRQNANPLTAGVFSYLEQLDAAQLSRLPLAANRAWAALSDALRFPDAAAVRGLDVACAGDLENASPERLILPRLRDVFLGAGWREGTAAAQAPRVLSLPLQMGLEAAHWARSLRDALL